MRLRRQKPSRDVRGDEGRERLEMLEVERVSKSFGESVVLDGVSLQLKRGDIALLVGANGSGKSTLLRCVAGLTGFDGAVRVLGTDARSANGRGLIGYLPQLVSLPESVTVGEVIAFFARLRGVSVHRPGELAAAVPLPDGFLPGLERPIGALSGGMRRRVALAAALIGSPPLVLLDEPAASLDQEHSESLWETLQALRAAGGTALIAMPLLVTSLLRHDLAGVADRAVLLEHGRVVHDGSVESLRPAPAMGAPSPVPPSPVPPSSVPHSLGSPSLISPSLISERPGCEVAR